MKKNAGIKPIPSRGANRVGSPRLIAMISSVVSLTFVVIYFGFFYKNEIIEISEKDKKDYLSYTPERVAENFIAALTKNEVQRALGLCKGSAREAILDGSIFRHLTRTGQYPKTNQRKDEASARLVKSTSVHSVDESRKSFESTPVTPTTRSQTALDQPNGDQKPSQKIGFPLAETKERNRHFKLPEPLVFSVHEYHKEKRNRVLLVGTAESKNTGRVCFRKIEVTLESSNSRWYVSRIVFE